MAFPTKKAWLEGLSNYFYELSCTEGHAQYTRDLGLDQPIYHFGRETRALKELVRYMNSAVTGAAPIIKDHYIAFEVSKLADEFGMPLIISLPTQQFM